MQIEFIANASFLIRLKSGKTVLTDPWWTDGVYYGSWFNFPPIPADRLERCWDLRPDAIYISHIHPDHLDPATLSRFPKDTPILIGRFSDPGFAHLKRSIEGLGFRDVRALTLWEPVLFHGAEIVILPQFAATNAAVSAGAGDFELDTSLWVRDSDGASVFNAVDNALHDDAAREIVERLGRPDVAILPYAGGSFFPQGCLTYTDAEKRGWRDAIGRRRLEGFLRHAAILDAPLTVPAAGTYVLGGRVAAASEYLHQATPGEIADAWEAVGRDAGALAQMACGDVIDTDTGAVSHVPDAPFRRHTPEQRWAFARSKAEAPLAHDAVSVPAAFSIQWSRLMARAAETMARAAAAQKLDLAYDVELLIRKNTVGSTPSEGFVHRFALDVGSPTGERRFIRFGADDGMWLMVLLGAAVWNNVEIASLMTCERAPDTQDPAIHTLMNSFRL